MSSKQLDANDNLMTSPNDQSKWPFYSCVFTTNLKNITCMFHTLLPD